MFTTAIFDIIGTMNTETLFLTVLAASKELGCSADSVRRFASSGKLPAIRTSGGIHLFRHEDVKLLARERAIGVVIFVLSEVL